MKYRYVGSGQGVPGLPNEITAAEAKAMGDTAYPDPADKKGIKRLSYYKQLMGAVQDGVYEEDKTKPKEVKTDG